MWPNKRLTAFLSMAIKSVGIPPARPIFARAAAVSIAPLAREECGGSRAGRTELTFVTPLAGSALLSSGLDQDEWPVGGNVAIQSEIKRTVQEPIKVKNHGHNRWWWWWRPLGTRPIQETTTRLSVQFFSTITTSSKLCFLFISFFSLPVTSLCPSLEFLVSCRQGDGRPPRRARRLIGSSGMKQEMVQRRRKKSRTEECAADWDSFDQVDDILAVSRYVRILLFGGALRFLIKKKTSGSRRRRFWRRSSFVNCGWRK